MRPTDSGESFRSAALLPEHTRVRAQAQLDRFGAEIGRRLRTLADSSDADMKRLASLARRYGLDPRRDLGLAGPDAVLARVPASRDLTAGERERGLHVLLSGGCVHEIFAAGEASRMREALRRHGKDVTDREAGAMYFLDLGHLAGEPYSLAWGPRQLLQLRREIERRAAAHREAGFTPEEAVRRQQIVLHVNVRMESEIARDLADHRFYGFSAERFTFVPQPVWPPFRLEEGVVTAAADLPPVPFGHLHPTMQVLVEEGAGWRLEGGRRTKVPGVLAEDLMARGGEVLQQRRINDLTKLSPDTADPDWLAFALRLLDRGHHYLVELVENPGRPDPRDPGLRVYQKGGLPFEVRAGVSDDLNRKLLSETISASDPETQEMVDQEIRRRGGFPYNKFSGVLRLKEARRVLDRRGADVNLEAKTARGADGVEVRYLNPQYVTGDVTHDPELNAAFFMVEGEEIHDFKDVSNLEEAVGFVRRQDADPELRALLREHLG